LLRAHQEMESRNIGVTTWRQTEEFTNTPTTLIASGRKGIVLRARKDAKQETGTP